ENGKLYIAQNPLYRLRKGKGKPVYVFNEEERDAMSAEMGGNTEISRFKGLGEMNAEELWDTTMNPEVRTLLQVNIEDRHEAEAIFTRLMGDEVAPRKRFITEYAKTVKNLDI
nr:DNA topoisomerase IV subunit B [bacterium]